MSRYATPVSICDTKGHGRKWARAIGSRLVTAISIEKNYKIRKHRRTRLKLNGRMRPAIFCGRPEPLEKPAAATSGTTPTGRRSRGRSGSDWHSRRTCVYSRYPLEYPCTDVHIMPETAESRLEMGWITPMPKPTELNPDTTRAIKKLSEEIRSLILPKKEAATITYAVISLEEGGFYEGTERRNVHDLLKEKVPNFRRETSGVYFVAVDSRDKLQDEVEILVKQHVPFIIIPVTDCKGFASTSLWDFVRGNSP